MKPIRKSSKFILKTILRQGPILATVSRASQHGLVPNALQNRLPPLRRDLVLTVANGKKITYRATDSDPVGQILLWKGWDGFESEMSRLFFDRAKTARIILDVGANTGYYTLLGLSASDTSKVIAFEPNPDIKERLSQNIIMNGWVHRVEVRGEAVSEGDGNATLFIPPGESPTMTTLDANRGMIEVERTLNVPVVSLDSALGHLRDIDLVKIDVEGFELKTLMGMRTILQESKPTIFVECLYDANGDFPDISEFLSDYNYRFFHLRSDGPVAVQSIEPDVTRKSKNFLCI